MKTNNGGTESPVVNAEEFRRMLRVCANTFGKLLKDGVLPPPMPLSTRERKWRRVDVERFFGLGS